MHALYTCISHSNIFITLWINMDHFAMVLYICMHCKRVCHILIYLSLFNKHGALCYRSLHLHALYTCISHFNIFITLWINMDHFAIVLYICMQCTRVYHILIYLSLFNKHGALYYRSLHLHALYMCISHTNIFITL